jgi:hypothetical protein
MASTLKTQSSRWRAMMAAGPWALAFRKRRNQVYMDFSSGAIPSMALKMGGKTTSMASKRVRP